MKIPPIALLARTNAPSAAGCSILTPVWLANALSDALGGFVLDPCAGTCPALSV